LLAARQRAGALLPALLEPRELLIHGVPVRQDLRASFPQIRAELEVVLDRQVREHHAALGRLGDAEADDVVRRHLDEVAALEADAPRADRNQARDRPQQRRLACPVRRR
jgi:hypothetical protein